MIEITGSGSNTMSARLLRGLHVGIALLPLAALTVGVPALAAPADGGRTVRQLPSAIEALMGETAKADEAAHVQVQRLAQAAPAPAGAQAGVKTVSPGDSLSLPKEVVSQSLSTKNYVIVTKAPAWLELKSAEKVGEGVWLVSPQNVEAARMSVAPAAAGQREVVFTIVDKVGASVSEARVKLQVAGGAAPAPAAAASSAVISAAEAKPSAVPAPAPAAAPAPAVAASAANAAAPPAPAATAAQAQAPASTDASVAKTWQDFIAGKKPAAAAKTSPAPAAASGATAPKSEAETMSLAKHLVRECTTCHSLYGEDNGIPLMIGLTKDRFLDTMDLYKSGKRDNVAMQSVAQTLSDEETLALALYLGRIKPPTQVASQGAATATGAIATDASLGAAPAARLEAGSAEAKRIDRWVDRAREMLEIGDVAQARLLLQRGAKLGHAQATLTLASTYDPNVLPWKPNMGPEAEPARARVLYKQAIELGAGSEAERRLAELP